MVRVRSGLVEADESRFAAHNPTWGTHVGWNGRAPFGVGIKVSLGSLEMWTLSRVPFQFRVDR